MKQDILSIQPGGHTHPNSKATSYRDVRGGIWTPPQNDGRHVDGGHARGGHSAQLSRDCQLHGTLPLLCDSAQRARDVRLLSCDGLLRVLTCGSSCELFHPVYLEDAVGSGHICSPLKYYLIDRGRDSCAKIQQGDGNLGCGESTLQLEREGAGLGGADIGPAASIFQTEHFGSVPIRLRVQHGCKA